MERFLSLFGSVIILQNEQNNLVQNAVTIMIIQQQEWHNRARMGDKLFCQLVYQGNYVATANCSADVQCFVILQYNSWLFDICPLLDGFDFS